MGEQQGHGEHNCYRTKSVSTTLFWQSPNASEHSKKQKYNSEPEHVAIYMSSGLRITLAHIHGEGLFLTVRTINKFVRHGQPPTNLTAIATQ
jgi:hypothetical protein